MSGEVPFQNSPSVPITWDLKLSADSLYFWYDNNDSRLMFLFLEEGDVENAVFSDKLDSLAREREYLACSLDKIHRWLLLDVVDYEVE